MVGIGTPAGRGFAQRIPDDHNGVAVHNSSAMRSARCGAPLRIIDALPVIVDEFVDRRVQQLCRATDGVHIIADGPRPKMEQEVLDLGRRLLAARGLMLAKQRHRTGHTALR